MGSSSPKSLFLHTCAETQDLDVIAGIRTGQGEHRGRKEHGLVVRVRNQQTYALVLQSREASAHHTHRVHVHDGQQYDYGRHEEEWAVHGGRVKAWFVCGSQVSLTGGFVRGTVDSATIATLESGLELMQFVGVGVALGMPQYIQD